MSHPNLIITFSTGMKRCGVKSITNDNASNGLPIQMKIFLLPHLEFERSITSERYPNMNPEKAIAIFPKPLPIPLNSAGIAKISLYAQKVKIVTILSSKEVPSLQIP